ncbi:uncharacterized protein OCT59_016092 [Rhizophagus irregularis]|uniref:F-box domain-containing protein n=3 Tax=Rhizophagus irregularis TaxID=588596 RepID=A0A015K303_RHIIW|nr:hypothetical protein RirG_055100 [Rhizophagus irregularis DAOM 197198w]UZO23761.1 hypothetical protein OCT59_016092 [Rhizophagus irregularis]GBC30997.1 hypothetical protein GLOIN_2v1530514 [Rhizophagus irregularis DAOM 181602=DAOM 197198]CAG8721000.1 10717_t:CDS:1 [Rhizophagus irregularis]
MSNLNKDILHSIFEELQDDGNSLYNLLSVDIVWSETIIPILWRNPWKYFNDKKNETISREEKRFLLNDKKKKSLLDVIISHLSNETRDTFKLTTTYEKPLFDYIGYCKHLNLSDLEEIIDIMEYEELDVYNEIFKLFINEKTRITHLYIPRQFNYQLHLIPGVENCLLGLEYLRCSTLTKDDVLDGLAEICKSIKELNFNIYNIYNQEGREDYNYDNVTENGIVKLIQRQKKLNKVHFYYGESMYMRTTNSNSLYKSIENSLIGHAKNIQYFSANKKPFTNILSSFKNLKSLEICDDYYSSIHDQPNFPIFYFPFSLPSLPLPPLPPLPSLQILKVGDIPINDLISLFKSSKGLCEIKIEYSTIDIEHNKRIIQAIYENCPNLKYLGIPFNNIYILELEKLLIKCQYLEGLYLNIGEVNYEELFETLARCSPNSLFRFKFEFKFQTNRIKRITLKSFKLFFHHWQGKHPMLLQTIGMSLNKSEEHSYLIENYKFLGVIKKYDDIELGKNNFKDFEWIKQMPFHETSFDGNIANRARGIYLI